jgi:hypothetical protein
MLYLFSTVTELTSIFGQFLAEPVSLEELYVKGGCLKLSRTRENNYIEKTIT